MTQIRRRCQLECTMVMGYDYCIQWSQDEIVPMQHVPRRLRAASMQAGEATDLNGNGDLKKPKAWLTAKHVPYIMAVHDCLGTMAAGMTIK